MFKRPPTNLTNVQCEQREKKTVLTLPMVSVGEIPHVFRAFYTTSRQTNALLFKLSHSYNWRLLAHVYLFVRAQHWVRNMDLYLKKKDKLTGLVFWHAWTKEKTSMVSTHPVDNSRRTIWNRALALNMLCNRAGSHLLSL